MLAINRFRVPVDAEGDFLARAHEAVAFLAGCAGNAGAELVRNLDEPDLWCLVTRWAGVGAYRRSFNGFQAKVILVPLLSEAIDEPGAYDDPDAVGENLPRTR
ncbi:antibiotic biosynthesis monooxygenase family protein [Micropruina sonneratiae]|uniref:antibiotic biosynthesis monooxygenase family protein n=1 Tax=Micropruina sonneratiae TaxID=2986940 RepID=UPI002226833B|nr:antibiotic biosynthesis monooxygenase family protein [Micropruina sp. KQZ13P-5]MCW3158487.1 antibiotic biosynthesis monooxygenase [Micropruina sp. KQZ13P-5]